MTETFDKKYSSVKEYKTFSEAHVALTCPPIECIERIIEFSSINDTVKILISGIESEMTLEFTGVSLFNFSITCGITSIGFIDIKKENDVVIAEIEVLGNFLNDKPNIIIKAKDVKMTVKEIEKEKYVYYSVKYEENQDKIFYYVSDIDNLQIGDYVWVPVRDTECAGIIVEIEVFEEGDEPFPLYAIKKIIGKISKEEYEEFWKNKVK